MPQKSNLLLPTHKITSLIVKDPLRGLKSIQFFEMLCNGGGFPGKIRIEHDRLNEFLNNKILQYCIYLAAIST